MDAFSGAGGRCRCVEQRHANAVGPGNVFRANGRVATARVVARAGLDHGVRLSGDDAVLGLLSPGA